MSAKSAKKQWPNWAVTLFEEWAAAARELVGEERVSQKLEQFFALGPSAWKWRGHLHEFCKETGLRDARNLTAADERAEEIAEAFFKGLSDEPREVRILALWKISRHQENIAAILRRLWDEGFSVACLAEAGLSREKLSRGMDSAEAERLIAEKIERGLSYQKVADLMNATGLRTARGKIWKRGNVIAFCDRHNIKSRRHVHK